MMIVSSPIYRARDRILRSVGSPTRNRHAMCASSGPIPTVEQVQVSQQCQYVWAITVVDSGVRQACVIRQIGIHEDAPDGAGPPVAM